MNPITRTPLATAQISPGKTITRVQVTRLGFQPGQATGRHFHPVPVLTQVESGSFIVQIEGQPERLYGLGEIIFEPAHTTIARYDNASPTASASAIAYYLAGDEDQTLIETL